MYDYLVVGAGLYGAVFAHEAKEAGKSVLVIDKRPNIAGNVYTEKIEGINVHKYGAHGITDNTESITAFRYNIMRSLFYCLNRRSQKKSYNWVEFLNRRMSGSGSMKYN